MTWATGFKTYQRCEPIEYSIEGIDVRWIYHRVALDRSDIGILR